MYGGGPALEAACRADEGLLATGRKETAQPKATQPKVLPSLPTVPHPYLVFFDTTAQSVANYGKSLAPCRLYDRSTGRAPERAETTSSLWAFQSTWTR